MRIITKKMSKNKTIKMWEFICQMAMMMSTIAICIDIVIPSMKAIASGLGFVGENSAQYTVGALLIGLAGGQIIYGPISDSIGRKKATMIGYVIFCFGSLLCLLSYNFASIITGRILQGFGGAAFRICSMAIIRDRYTGRDMARITSIVMTVFIVVPIIAPTLGQIIIMFAHWRFIFAFLLVYTTITFLWMYFRLNETITKERKKPFNTKAILHAFAIVFKNKQTIFYTICSGLAFAGMVGYISSCQQILQGIYGVGNLMPFYFAISALSIGVSSMLNSFIVKKYGMKFLCKRASLMIFTISICFILAIKSSAGKIDFFVFIGYILVVFFCFGMLFGNFTALAMEPMGANAGTASSVVGTLSSVVSTGFGTFIGQQFNGTIFPLVFGFFALACLSLLFQSLAEKCKS